MPERGTCLAVRAVALPCVETEASAAPLKILDRARATVSRSPVDCHARQQPKEYDRGNGPWIGNVYDRRVGQSGGVVCHYYILESKKIAVNFLQPI